MGNIFYVMGKSSSGKDTIFKEVLNTTELGLKNIILYTTRPIRVKEENGVEYFFVTEEKLHELERANRVIEVRAYHTVYGVWKYFTADEGQMDLAHENYIAIGTLESYEKMKEYFGEETVVPVYIEVSDGQRLERAMRRERKQAVPKYEEMCRRFLADTKDFSEENIQQAGIEKRFLNNKDRQECTREVVEFIRNRIHTQFTENSAK